MCSSVASSCRVWNYGIQDAHKVVGDLGDLEHMRSLLVRMYNIVILSCDFRNRYISLLLL